MAGTVTVAEMSGTIAEKEEVTNGSEVVGAAVHRASAIADMDEGVAGIVLAEPRKVCLKCGLL